MSPAADRRGETARSADRRGPSRRRVAGTADAAGSAEQGDDLDLRLPAVEVVRGVVATTPLLDEDGVDVLVVPVAPAAEDEDGVQPRSGTTDAAVRYGVDLAEAAERAGLTGAAGDHHVLLLPRPIAGGPDLPWAGLPSRLVLLGVGSGDPADLRRAGAALAKAVRGVRTVVTTVGNDGGPDGAAALVEGYCLASYRHPRTGRTVDPPVPERLVLLGRFQEEAVQRGLAHARASWTARVLTSTPSSVKSPRWFADRARQLAEAEGLTVEVVEGEELAERGFGGIVAVGGASATPPCLVVVRWEPPSAPTGVPARHVVLVGKGITYDTGGISIKPREAMVSMKTDMAGAGAVLAAVVGAARASVPHRVTALLPMAENAVGGAAYRPGDVLTLHGGTTVEIANTDAEGRLVLADALAWADRELEPDVLVDVATLTGAASVGLSRHVGALYCEDRALADALLSAGAEVGETLWRMPLVADYKVALHSEIADIRHVPADASVGAGSITAALFLERFVGERRWAHLDVAGPARSGSSRHEIPEGATGFAARTLLRWLTRAA